VPLIPQVDIDIDPATIIPICPTEEYAIRDFKSG